MARAGWQEAPFQMSGGMDLITPALVTNPGTVRASVNYESTLNGYQRFIGYERFDGRPAPHSASFWQLGFAFGNVAIVEGATVTGQTSGATGVLLSQIVQSGSYGGSDAAGVLGLGVVTGTFVDGENLQVGGVTKAICDGSQEEGASPDDETARSWQASAISNARALIFEVPGEGPVRGVWNFDGEFYAFRDNVGATEGVMHKASTAGWTAVTLSKMLAFTSGGGPDPDDEILEGQTIVGESSGATATVARIVRTSGRWEDEDAAGYFVFASQTGTFGAETIKVGTNLNLATLSGDSETVTLPPGGRYSFVNHNFYASENLKRMYGVNGVGLAFEFDGTLFTPITAIPGNPAADIPASIAVHKQALALGYLAGAVEISAVGEPYNFDGQDGAVDWGTGDAVVELVSTRGALIALCENSVQIMYGNDSTDYQFTVLTDEAGALPYSAQVIAAPVYMDNRGVRSLSATQEYGNFNIGTLSQAVRPLIQRKLESGILPVASVRARSRDTYRVFFSDNSGLSVFIGKRNPECMMLDLGIPITCACSIEDEEHAERIMFGSDNGFVYEMDRGNSFDGEDFFRYLRFPFNHCRSPNSIKRFKKVKFGCTAAPGTVISVKAEYDYGDPESATVDALLAELTGGGGQWDLSSWDSFYWDAPFEGQGSADLDGVGRNVSLVIAGDTTDQTPDLLQDATIYFTWGGFVRE